MIWWQPTVLSVCLYAEPTTVCPIYIYTYFFVINLFIFDDNLSGLLCECKVLAFFSYASPDVIHSSYFTSLWSLRGVIKIMHSLIGM